VTTEEILAALDARFSCPAGPVRHYATTPQAPPPPDPPAKKPKFDRTEVVPVRQKAITAPKQPRQRVREKKTCPHPRWHRVRGSESLLSCSRCRTRREADAEEIARLFPPRPPKPITHGTRTGYFRGCRCEMCIATERKSRKERYWQWKSKNPRVPKKFTRAPENCQHPRWWKCSQRKRLDGTIAIRVQCRSCGDYRTCEENVARHICSGAIIPPDQVPQRLPRGAPKTDRHGTHAMYRRGCRCEMCFDFHAEYKRARYQKKYRKED
jgi:hypothetical protein